MPKIKVDPAIQISNKNIPVYNLLPNLIKSKAKVEVENIMNNTLTVSQDELRGVLFDGIFLFSFVLFVSERTAFVLNLPYNITEKNLKDDFSIAGSILKIRMKKRQDGKSIGFAHITFSSSVCI